jgi:hypothetical protein
VKFFFKTEKSEGDIKIRKVNSTRDKTNFNKQILRTMVRNHILLLVILLCFTHLKAQPGKVAESPAMGWNSYTTFGASVTECEVMANAGFMATQLKPFGWQYVVVGYCWYYPYPAALNNPQQVSGFIPWLNMDKYGRLLPATERFHSARKNKGFKPLADAIHCKGLKFGIEMMRGIPRQAVQANTGIKGSKYHARDIADTNSKCTWLNHMYGVNMDKPGAQEYYNSLFELYARWGVDFVKVDDITYPFSEKEIIAIRKAIIHCGRPMVLSLSPGETPLAKAEVVRQYSDSWRISNDFRDNWKALKQMFALLHAWENYIGPGHFADADMLNIGLLSQRGPTGDERYSELTRNEQISMMTLWCIARSPLMYGGDLTKIRTFELQMLQNKAVMQVNQNSANNRQLFRDGDHVAWIAGVPGSNDKYVAVFNLGESSDFIRVVLDDLGLTGECNVIDLWSGTDLGKVEKAFRPEVFAHGARLFRVSKN